MMQLLQISRVVVLKEGLLSFLQEAMETMPQFIGSLKKNKRVVKSTIAAETLELLEAAEHCFFIRTFLC